MTELLRFVVEWDPYLTSENYMSGKPLWSQTKLKNGSRAAALTALARIEQCFIVAIQDTVIVRRGSRMDARNIRGALKWQDDVLYSIWRDNHGRGLVPTDGDQWVRPGLVTLEVDQKWKGREHCLYIIETDPQWTRPKPPRGIPKFQRLSQMSARR